MFRLFSIVLTSSILAIATIAATKPATKPATKSAAKPTATTSTTRVALPEPKPVPLLTPEQEIATFQLPPGLRVELVAAEPMVEHPVFITFDGDGRMWVAEMRGYMPNVIGWGEEKPTGRVSVLEDTDGDGRMDRKTVFLDKLVLPRAIGFIKDGVLIGSPPNLLLCRDRDGDLKCDEQRVIDPHYAVVGNPENFANGLLYNLDNWIYNADHDKRLKVRNGKVVMSKIPVLGQWGITRDDFGRLFFNTNSDYLRGSLVPPHYSSRNPKSPIALADLRIAKDQTVWPAHAATVNRGYRENFLRPDGTLKEFTAACSPMIYRGDLFKDFYGNAFACEATSNFIRRAVITESKDGILTADAAEKGKEFLASTYERFRPVNLQTGPDGAIYVVDMHHGLIQHRISITEFAKEQYTKKQLDKHLLTGRIFRIVPDSGAPRVHPQLSKATTEQLVQQLTHPNGWWRDTAQRLLVERGDAAAVERLKRLARDAASPVHQINALWTLEGMDRLDAETIRLAMGDPDGRVRAQAIRLAEGIPAAHADAIQCAADHPAVAMQHTLTLGEIATPEADVWLAARLRDQWGGNANIRDAAVSGLAGREIDFLRGLLANPQWRDATPGRRAVMTAIARSVVRREDGRDILRLVELIAAAAPADSQSKSWHQLAMLDAIPAPQRDEYGTAKVIQVAAKPAAVDRLNVEKISALFQWPDKPMPPKPPVAPLTPAQEKLFEVGRQQFTAVCAQCHQKDGMGQEGKAPPLVNSPWVLGPQSRLIRIVLHGMKGPVTLGGRDFNGDMPSWKAMTDEQIAGVLTYVRREWGHEAPAIDTATVQGIRDWTQARRDGWTEAELLEMK
jgi:mono/diheme cytochrome c family protein/glucose/arabinose dehydrogenase